MTNTRGKLDEMQVNLGDLVMRIFLNWRQILIWMIVGAVVLGGIGTLQSYQQYRQTEQQLQNESIDGLSQLRAELSALESKEVEDSFSLYLMLREDYDYLWNYNTNSLKMQLDPSDVTVTTIWYQVDNFYQIQYPIIDQTNNISNIIYSYILLMQNSSLYETIIQTLGLNTTVSYLKELVYTSAGDGDDSGIFYVSILSDSEEDGQQILNAIEREIEERTVELQQQYGEFEISILDQQTSTGFNQELWQEQQDQKAALSKAMRLCRDVSSYMTDDQEAYFEALVEKQEMEEDGIQEEDIETSTLSVPEFQPIRAKYILVGAFLGAFLECAWVVVRYLSSKKLRVVEDLTDYFQLPMLGIFFENKKNGKALTKVDKKIYSWFQNGIPHLSEDHAFSLAVSRIKTTCEKCDIKNIYITGTGNSAPCIRLKEILNGMLQEEKLEVSNGASVIWNAQSLENMVASEGVVFVERIGESKYSELRESIALCEQYCIPILGCIVVY